MRDLLDPLDAPVYCVDKSLLHEIVGFDLHRGAIAAADRRPPPTLDERDRRRRPDRRARRTQRPREPGRDRSQRTGARHRRARARPDVHRSVHAPHGPGEHGRDPLPAGARVDATEWPDRDARSPARGRVRDVGDDARRRQPPTSGTCRFPNGSPSCSAPRARIAPRHHRGGRPSGPPPDPPDVDSLNVGAAAAATFAIVGSTDMTPLELRRAKLGP